MSKKAKDLCSGVSVLHDENVELAEQVLFMAKKLKEAQRVIKDEPLVIEYDNGGGQSGIRENPHFVSYEHLMNSYTRALKQLSEVVKKGKPTAKSSDVFAQLNVIAGKKVG